MGEAVIGMAATAEVVVLSVYRAKRDARNRVAAERRLHPSLRWVAGEHYWEAHARNGGTAACGAPGRLILAPPGVPLCAECWPDPPHHQ